MKRTLKRLCLVIGILLAGAALLFLICAPILFFPIESLIVLFLGVVSFLAYGAGKELWKISDSYIR